MIMHRSSKQWSKRYIQKLKCLFFFLSFFVLFNITNEVTNAPLVFFLFGQYNRHFLCEWNDCSILFKLNRSIYGMNSMCVFVIGWMDGWMVGVKWPQENIFIFRVNNSFFFVYRFDCCCVRMQQLIFKLCWWQTQKNNSLSQNWKYQTIGMPISNR